MVEAVPERAEVHPVGINGENVGVVFHVPLSRGRAALSKAARRTPVKYADFIMSPGTIKL
jgi:hypothetical protein